MAVVREINLFYRQGSADKVYNVWIEDAEPTANRSSGYHVRISWGRRGSALQTGFKTTAPTSRAFAETIADTAILDKTRKGYQYIGATVGSQRRTSVSASIPVTNASAPLQAAEQFGALPQLLNSVEESKLDFYLKSNEWYMQEKKDGKNFLARLKDGQVKSANRRGLVIPTPSETDADLKALDYSNLLVCGEHCGSKYYIFDVLEINEEDIRTRPYYYRFNELGSIDETIQEKGLQHIEVLDTFTGYVAKKAEYDRLKAAGAEGVVFKKSEAPYTVGRPNSGGDQVKFKFTQSATCIVGSLNEKRSVSINLYDQAKDEVVTIGNVTILPNFPVPKIGQYIEVKYLYAYRGGSLYQPIYLGVRDDKTQCDDISTLKYKQEGSEEDDV